MEKIELITKERIEVIKNSFNEITNEYVCENTFVFKKGRVYGIICEHGGGGEAISSFLSNHIPYKEEKIFIDDVEMNASDIQSIGWYMGNPIYSNDLIKREKSVRQALNYVIKKYHQYKSLDEVIDEFHLEKGKLDYCISHYGWEKWRASMAIGRASEKKIYCFPWMNTLYFYDCMVNSSVYRFFKKLKNEGSIIILPTSRYENVAGLVDEIIEICPSRFKYVISQNKYFKEYY
ncbi:MAG: hypothetical protein K2M46_02970 [Lachnospiraceae bacterium]|nr:hypothetical protein [Lachnospiraceae bacterium]